MRRVVATAPGKLFVAGEYAVVEGGEPAVLVGVDRRVTLTVTEVAEAVPISQGRYVAAVLDVMTQVAQARGVLDRAPAFAMSSSSALTDPASAGAPTRKYGLGSSGAVTVAAVRALDAWFGLALTPMELLKAAILATLRVNPRASGADVATSLFGGWLGYSAASPTWVIAHDGVASHSADVDVDRVAGTIVRPWPGLDVAAFDSPTAFELSIGWTGSPASTTDLVAAVRAAGETPSSFLRASREAVGALMQALDGDDAEGAVAAVRAARAGLSGLAAHAGVAIETPPLARLIELAEQRGLAAKSSGAGGGDCGIALGPVGAAGDLDREWQAAGIWPLAWQLAGPSSVEESGE